MLHFLTKLHEPFQSMAFLERRRASKWHERVTATAQDLRPAPVDCSAFEWHLFPYAQLRAVTKEYLNKRSSSQAEKDQRLKALIATHVPKDVAFAACAADLSATTIEELLLASFRVDPETLHGLGDYLQAVVVVANCKHGHYSPADLLFATGLAPIARDVGRVIRPITIEAIFSAWTKGAPEDALLLSRAKLVTKRLCGLLNSTLTGFANRSQWQRAFEYRKGLSLLAIAAERANVSLKRCLDAHFATWRGWTEWTPSVFQLHSLASIQKNSLGARELRMFSDLAEIDGPDLAIEGSTFRCKWRRLTHESRMLSWFLSKGFSLGPGLITGDSEELLNRFIPEFLNTASHALEGGRISALLLLHFINKAGLDSHTLSLWQSAMSLLAEPLPQFVSYIVDVKARHGNDFDITVTYGLHALTGEAHGHIRETIQTEVGECVQRATRSLTQQFESRFSQGEDWIIHAKRLWELRETITRSKWLQGSLDEAFVKACAKQLSMGTLEVLHDLHRTIKTLSERLSFYQVQTSVDGYVHAFVMGESRDEDEATGLAPALHSLWQSTDRAAVRRTAIHIAYCVTFRLEDKHSCIQQLGSISDVLLEGLEGCLVDMRHREPSECIRLARIIVIFSNSDSVKPCWQALVKWTLEQYEIRLDQRALTAIGFDTYRQCMLDLRIIFGDSMEELSRIQAWLSRLQPFCATLRGLEGLPDSDTAMHCILTGMRNSEGERYVQMLRILQDEANQGRLQLMQYTALCLRDDLGQSELVCEAIRSFSKLDDKGFRRCDDLIRINYSSRQIGAVRLAVWLRMAGLDTATEASLLILGQVLQMGLNSDLSPSAYSLKPAKMDYDDRVSRLVGIAQQLEASRMTLRRTDPGGLHAVMDHLGIEQPSGTSTLLADLPNHLLDFVEENGDDGIDLHFSLTGLSVVEKLACGLVGSEFLLVHLRVDPSGSIDGFCVHLEENVGNMDSTNHTFFEIDRSDCAPNRMYCNSRLNRLTYAVARGLWRQLKSRESTLERIHDGIGTTIQTIANRCLVCGRVVGARLHRATICNSSQCRTTYARSDLAIRLQDLQTDTQVVDLLLTTVFAAAVSGDVKVLPERPALFSNASQILALLKTLPSTVEMRTSVSFRPASGGYGKDAEVFGSWMLNCYRGFIISAPSQYRIPNLPNILQFVLVDAAPDKEAAFAAHDNLQPRRVYFHGTSMARLYPILAQGLRVLSDTALQRSGASLGAGIYLADEPNYAMGHAEGAGDSGRATSFFNWRADFRHARVLLGCEHAGNDPGSMFHPGVHVITDPSRVMVRYIFLVPPTVQMPRAQDIRRPMLSAFNSLRSSAAPALN